MEIEILGTGCPKCKKLAELAKETADELDVDCEIRKITDINDIMTRGVMMTPALAVDGDVKVFGKVPSKDEIKKILSEAL